MAHRQLRESSSSSSYMALLNTLASDLDYMLSDLCTTPPPPYENGDIVDREEGVAHLRGDAFLEPYMQGLAPPDFSPSQRTNAPAADPRSAEQRPHTATPEDGGSVTSSPAGDNHNTLADISAQFRLLELDGSADSLDQGHDSSRSSSAVSSGGDGSSEGGNAPCVISLLERLIRTHPVWFLPGIQRAGAFHLLQGKEEGNFVVRQSSQPDTMAISVRLPAGKGPYIEHYLIQAVDAQLSLESSDNRFSNIPSLIAHYSQCCDELPVQLTLPRAMREAKNHQQLSSLALLGQEFWRYPMANPRPPEQRSQQHSGTSTLQQRMAVGESLQSPPSSGSSLSSLGSGNNNHNSMNDTATRTPTSELGGGSSIGDAIVLNLAPLSSAEHLQQPQSVMSTFKGSAANSSCDVIGSPSSPASISVVPGVGTALVTTANTTSSITATTMVRGPRPTPPNTLNLMCSASSHTNSLATSGMRSACNSPAQVLSPPSTNLTNGDGSRAGPLVVSGGGGGGKTPPPPPPRWAKPTSLSSVAVPGQNFTVTTTVTFSMNHNTTPPPHVEVSCVQVTPKRPQVESDSLQTVPSHCSNTSTSEQRGVRLHQVMSPTTPSDISKLPGNGRGKKHRPSHGRQTSIKESHHYQESDILESPTVYYRSSVADKVSDYEDIWGPEMLSTFKPPHPVPRSSPFSSPEDISSSSGGNKKTPDLLERIGTPVSSSCVSLNSVNGNLKEQQQRNRLGLVINTGNGTNSITNSPMSPLSTEPKQQQAEEPGTMSPNGTKQGSPFYAEPADALRQAALVPRRRPRPGGQQIFQQQARNHRHSDPASFQQWPVLPHHTGHLERIDSNDELTTTPLSSSVDNLALLKTSRNGNANQQNVNRPRGKPVQPPRVRPKTVRGKCYNDTSWTVDSSWEFIGNEDDGEDAEFLEGAPEERERRFPTLEQQESTLGDGDGVSSGGRKITVQELIAQRLPALRLSPEIALPNAVSGISSPLDSRISSYDNVEGRNGNSHDSVCTSDHSHNSVLNPNYPNSNYHCASQISDSDDTQTVFSEPWDSSRWENLLHPDHIESGFSPGSSSILQVVGATPLLGPEEDDTMCDGNINGTHLNSMVNGCSSSNGHNVSRSKSFKERLDPLLSPPRLQALRNRELGGTGSSIRAYALHLAADKSTTFAQNIDNFIACTRDSRETNPQVVMRNMRQFMSGMKNYLVKHGEREFEKEVEKERMKLKSTEFLNLDAILESVMHKLVVRPLKEHLYQLFVEEYTRTGAIQLLADNIQYARTKPMNELGVRARIVPPSQEALETICQLLRTLQEVDSPLEKLESLLACIGTIFNSVKSSNQRCVTLGADDFLPLFVWVLVQSGMLAAEIEADYMWGLLHPSLLSGEGGYYLTTLSSAVHVLKNFRLCSEEQSKTLGPGASLDWRVASLTEFRSVLKIVVPDEMHGSIITKTLPVRPNMTTRDVCKIIAHKVRITNPQDYGLFKLVDGEETLLGDGECPQDIKGNVAQAGKHCMFAYKRIDAKIAWPRTSSPH